MLSRSIRLLSQISNKQLHKVNLQRNGGHGAWVYRSEPAHATRWRFWAADFLSAFTWWWIFTHLYYQPGHVFGEYDYPEPSKYTNEELGVEE